MRFLVLVEIERSYRAIYIKKYTYEERIKYHRANKKRQFYQCNKKSDPRWHSLRTEAEIIRQDITTPRQAFF